MSIIRDGSGTPLSSEKGVLVSKPYSLSASDWNFAVTAPITGVADTAIKASAGTGINNYLTGIQLINTAAVATEVVIKAASTIIWRGFLPASMTQPFAIAFGTPLKTGSSQAINFAAITTGASIYVSAQGYSL